MYVCLDIINHKKCNPDSCDSMVGFKDIVLGEISIMQKEKYHMLSILYNEKGDLNVEL
jgi:hypothetical protein